MPIRDRASLPTPPKSVRSCCLTSHPSLCCVALYVTLQDEDEEMAAALDDEEGEGLRLASTALEANAGGCREGKYRRDAVCAHWVCLWVVGRAVLLGASCRQQPGWGGPQRSAPPASCRVAD